MGEICRREFLGWSEPFLPRAAAWLVDRHRSGGAVDLHGVLVVLPGRRAARRLEELIVERAGAALVPPALVTEGELATGLSDRALGLASSSASAVAWIEALRALPAARLARAVSLPPEGSAAPLAQWLAVARQAGAAFEELAAESLDFTAVARRTDLGLTEREREVFAALADAEQRYEAALARSGLVDPARAAAEVLRRGALRTDVRVVLAGVPELARTHRALLAALREPATSLVFAPETERDAFDEWGTVVPRAWAEREIDLTRERWRVVDDVRALAHCAVEWLRGLGGSVRAEDVTLGALDRALPAYLERALAREGLHARVASGVSFERAGVAALLRAFLEHSRSRSFASFAALARHPDLEAACLRDASAPEAADELFAERLPARVGEGEEGASDAARRFAAVRARVEALAGAFSSSAARPLPEWMRALKRWIAAIYPEVERDPRDAVAWRRAHAVLATLDAADEVEALAGTAGGEPPTSPADALELVLARAGRAAIPEPPRAGAIEVLGWLELALDDAPALFVGGFSEGAVPEPPRSEALFSDALRRALGLADEERRVARDVYLASAILASRPATLFASARRGADGDPLRPSRLAFHRPADEIPERVLAFFGRRAALQRAPGVRVETTLAPAFVPFRVPERLHVTSFATYIRSPYEFYLRHVLGLETCDDSARELDPLGFGVLAHDLLARFGTAAVRDSTDSEEIAAWLSRELDGLARARFGRAPLAAVRVQIEQLRLRAGAFARWQAAQRRAGWTIERSEHAVESFALDVDGTPQRLAGRIDRVDRHAASGAWRVLDYKTGERPKRPEDARTRTRGWVDLQLPLYREMLRGELGEALALGYVVLPADPRKTGASMADWSAAELDQAVEKARQIVRELRTGEIPARGKVRPRERVFAALEGWGVLGTAEDVDSGGGDAAGDGDDAEAEA